MAEEARLESVCTPKGYREFESRSLRKDMIHSRLRKQLAVFVDRPRRKLAYVRGLGGGNRQEGRQARRL